MMQTSNSGADAGKGVEGDDMWAAIIGAPDRVQDLRNPIFLASSA